MSFEVTRAVTILTPAECDKMVVSEADNGILFYSNDGSIVQRWSFENISHVCLYSKRENKAQVKFACGQKRELKFKTFYELQHFFQVMKALAGIRLVDGNKIVQPPLRGQKVKEVVEKFETLGKKKPELVLPPKVKEQAPPKPGPSSPEVKEPLVKFSEPLVVRMTPTPPSPAPKSSIVPKSIMKVWKALTPKPKLAVTLTVAPKPILKKIEAPKIEAPKVEAPKVEDSKPEPPKSDPPKPEPPKSDPPKPETLKSAPLKPKRRAPPVPAPKIEAPAPAPAPKPIPNVQIKAVGRKKSQLERLVEEMKEKELKKLETSGFKVVKHEQKAKPKIVGVTFKN